MPVILVELRINELVIGGSAVIDCDRVKVGILLHAIETTVSTIPLLDIGIVAMSGIIPVAEIHRAVRSDHEIDADVLWIGTKEDVVPRMPGAIASGLANIDLMV